MSRELLKRALDALDGKCPVLRSEIETCLDQPESEPVAWIEVGHPIDGPYECHYMAIMPIGRHHVYTTPPDQSARVAELHEEANRAKEYASEMAAMCKELEQQLAALQAKQEPLSSDAIRQLYRTAFPRGPYVFTEDAVVFARAIEAAHGITGGEK